MLRSTSIVTIVLIIILVLAGIYTYTRIAHHDARDAASARTLGEHNPDASYTDLAGEAFSFEAYEGTIRVVNVWASWTPFSAQELPMLASVAQDYPQEEVVFIAINRKEPNVVADAFLATLRTTDGLILVQDPTDAFYRSVDGAAMPETIIFDREGEIVYHKRGPITESEVREALSRVRN